MSYTNLVDFTNGYEDSQSIDFSKMTTRALFRFIDQCKRNAALKRSAYWLGIAENANRAAMSRKLRGL